MKRNVSDFTLKEQLDVNKKHGAVSFNEIIIDMMDLQEGLSVLDVARGNGHFTKQVNERVGNGLVAGLDQSEKLIGVLTCPHSLVQF